MTLSREKINLALARKKMTVTQLAKKYGVSAQRIRAILNSKKVVPATAGRIAEALEVDVTEIIE